MQKPMDSHTETRVFWEMGMLGQKQHMSRAYATEENFLLSLFPRREETALKTDMLSGKLPGYL